VAERLPKPQFEPLGEAALLLRFGDAPDPDLAARLQSFARTLGRQRPAGVIELVPAFASLAVHFDPLQTDLDRVAAWVRAGLREPESARDRAAGGRRVELSVCYGGELGPDLAALAAHAGLNEEDVIRRHSQAEYVVAMIGFLPGFPYLLGLDPALAMPRLETPRVEVPAGSLGIGGNQTGLYPQASPGGWRLIGRSPQRLFDPTREAPSLLLPGDRVRFVPISLSEFELQQSRQQP